MTFSDANFSAIRSIVFVGIGGNLDHPVIHVQRALQDMDAVPETALMKISSMYETAPVGLTDQPVFVNAVAQVATTLSPHEFLRRLHAIEAEHGRLRNSVTGEKNAPRTLDLDILLFDDLQIDERGLTVPHPRMHERAFVLVPLVEIAPEIVIPGKGVAKELLAVLDRSGVALLQPEEY
jgi:2-amino-4-hydroxy-6-hydroxymethyldihydropteridine diphosphokinase